LDRDRLIGELGNMDELEAKKVRKKMVILEAELNYEKAKLLFESIKKQDKEYVDSINEEAEETEKKVVQKRAKKPVVEEIKAKAKRAAPKRTVRVEKKEEVEAEIVEETNEVNENKDNFDHRQDFMVKIERQSKKQKKGKSKLDKIRAEIEEEAGGQKTPELFEVEKVPPPFLEANDVELKPGEEDEEEEKAALLADEQRAEIGKNSEEALLPSTEVEEDKQADNEKKKGFLYGLKQIFIIRLRKKEDQEETIDLRDVEKDKIEETKQGGLRLRAVEITREELEKDEVLDLKGQVAKQKRIKIDASLSPSYQERELDLRSEEQKEKSRKEKLRGDRKPTQIVNEDVRKIVEVKKDIKKTKEKIKERPDTRMEAKLKVQQKEINELYHNIKFSDIPNGPREYTFPEGFLWGTSTSAYQVEGDIVNDWSLWEKGGKRSLKLMKEGKSPIDYICGQACDSYNRYEEDLDLATSLNTNAVRFGLEWARIQPRRGTWDMAVINHYRNVLKAAKARGLTTAVTLWHWTNPLWFTKKGAWENEKNIDSFKQYVKLAAEEFGSHVDYWITLNEPMVHVFNGYLTAKFPPMKRSPFKAKQVMKNLANAHIGAYNILHRRFPRAKVSITKLRNYYEPANPYNPIEKAIANTYNHFSNKVLLGRIKRHIDYVGFDYYFHDRITWHPPFIKNENKWITDMGWEIYPEGIYNGLKMLSRFGKPIVVMENGLADSDDKLRPQFIKEHLYWVWKAIQEGVKVDGYFYWSLLDNFEWDKGWRPKFGLFEVNRETFERKKRASADVYAEICKGNKLRL